MLHSMSCFLFWQEVKRGKAEQNEKARLRHKHALAQLQLEEVRTYLKHFLLLRIVTRRHLYSFTEIQTLVPTKQAFLQPLQSAPKLDGPSD